jgi:hypothetical protein
MVALRLGKQRGNGRAMTIHLRGGEARIFGIDDGLQAIRQFSHALFLTSIIPAPVPVIPAQAGIQ